MRKGWWSNGVSAHGLEVARGEEGLVVEWSECTWSRSAQE